MESRLLFWLLLQLVCFANSQPNQQEEDVAHEIEFNKTSDEPFLKAAEQLSKLVHKVILNQEDAAKELRQLKDENKLLKEKVENSELQNRKTSQDIKQETQKVASLVIDLSGKINGLSEQKCDCQAISSSLVQIKESLVNVANASDSKIIQSIENSQHLFCSNIEEKILEVQTNVGEEYLESILQLTSDTHLMVKNIESHQNETTSNFSTPLTCKVDESSGNAREVKEEEKKEDKKEDKSPATRHETHNVDCKLIKEVVTSETLFQLDNGLYFFNNSLLSWNGARDMCHSLGMQLPPRMTLLTELMMLRNSFKYDYGLWVSASDIGRTARSKGRFHWTDGKVVAGKLFLSGHPAIGPSTTGKEYCLFVEKVSAKLADWTCNLSMHVACYIPANLHYCLKHE